MNSLEIVEFRMNIENYIDTKGLPSEVVRMVLAEILGKVSAKVNTEISEQLKARAEQKEVAE